MIFENVLSRRLYRFVFVIQRFLYCACFSIWQNLTGSKFGFLDLELTDSRLLLCLVIFVKASVVSLLLFAVRFAITSCSFALALKAIGDGESRFAFHKYITLRPSSNIGSGHLFANKSLDNTGIRIQYF